MIQSSSKWNDGKHSKYEFSTIMPIYVLIENKKNAISVIGRGGLWGCETSKIPYFLDKWHRNGVKVVRLTR
jgi:hypothetical protein